MLFDDVRFSGCGVDRDQVVFMEVDAICANFTE
jgi:hypothetical protein